MKNFSVVKPWIALVISISSWISRNSSCRMKNIFPIDDITNSVSIIDAMKYTYTVYVIYLFANFTGSCWCPLAINHLHWRSHPPGEPDRTHYLTDTMENDFDYCCLVEKVLKRRRVSASGYGGMAFLYLSFLFVLYFSFHSYLLHVISRCLSFLNNFSVQCRFLISPTFFHPRVIATTWLSGVCASRKSSLC